MLLTLRILVWRAAPALRVLALATLLLLAARTLAPAPEATRPVVVAAHRIEAGTVLAAADLRVRQVPTNLVPEDGIGRVDALTGRTLGVEVPPGLPVVAPLLAGDRFTVDPPEGTVVIWLAVDQTAVRSGDLVDVLASDCDGAGPVADAALVVDDTETDALALTETASSVPVAVRPDEALALSQARLACALTLVFVG